MAKNNVDMNLVKLAVDTYKGHPEKYSVEESMETLRNAMIEINGGTQFGYKEMRDAQYNGLFALVEEILPRTIVEGLVGDEFFMRMVDFRNVAEGDMATFEVEDVNWFEIGEVAHGSRGLRRQRVGGKDVMTVATKLHGVRIYEPLRRLLAKRTDFNQFITRVSESYRQNILNEIYTFYSGLTATEMGNTYFPNAVAGTYSESATLDVIEHVEAACGKAPIIMGTAKALRNLAPSIQGAESKSDLYNLGLELCA